MYCCKKLQNDLWWVGANDRRLALFEGVYKVPNGVSYNSYLLLDEKTVVFDTVDKAVSDRFFENIEHVLNGKAVDYLVVQHMEPDHSATMFRLMEKYPNVRLVCNAKILAMAKQFFPNAEDLESRALLVKEGDTLCTGKHTLTFVMAPMVHWPEVMVTYDTTDKILFSADAFGVFGALNGAIFADEVNFERDHLDEARRYYTNIVGKYGTQVQALLKKAAGLDISLLCPLHGFVWRKNIGDFINKYQLWSTYTPEEQGVMIAYASVYGNTENAAEILSSELRERGIQTAMYDVSMIAASDIVAAAFKYSHLVFASTTYNAGIFVTMEALLADLTAHNIQNRTVAFLENGSWAPTSGNLMKAMFDKCKNITLLEDVVTIKSALAPEQHKDIRALAEQIAATFPKPETTPEAAAMLIDNNAMFKLSYGLFVLSAKDGGKDNGCIINTAIQVTDSPKRISVTVNKNNLTHDMIHRSGLLNLSVLSTDATFATIEKYGFASGREVEKFTENAARTQNGVAYVTDGVCAVLSAKVIAETDCGTHTTFLAEVTEAHVLSEMPAMTYAYYFEHVKPKPSLSDTPKTGYICKICGYVYEGETLPPDFICPLCKHGAEDFEKIQG